MKPPTEEQAIPEIIDRLAGLFGNPPKAVRVKSVGATHRYDYAISVGGRRLMGEYKGNASAGMVSAAIEGLRRESGTALPLVVVPFMGEVGRQLCDGAGMSWLDLCGNAKIVAPGLRIWIEGRPNKFIERGRPPNVFASKSSRIARQLLLHPKEHQTQVNLARRTGLDDGYVSKIVRRLQQENYVEVDEERAVRPRDPNLLLDAWHDAYVFDRHRIIKGHVTARSGDELLHRIAKSMLGEKTEWSVTGLGAAWLYTGFAAFRLATVYLSAMPSCDLLDRMEFSEEPKGANLWLVLPDDEGVFHGGRSFDGIRCVSSVQTYLDLKGQPERSKDAAQELHRKCLNWGRHGA